MSGPPKPVQRPDIQGLRTLAVGLVIVFHLDPSWLPGGFIGVDVFFVISGFLIIGSLVREAERSGTVDLAAFYSRRVRRLLPAATLVTVLTLAASLVFLPTTRWLSIAWDAIMSALQVQNWNQAYSANSYADATAAPSPLQHYWSLAVEEQFYLVIPFLVIACCWVARSAGLDRRRVVWLALAVIVGASLIHSAVISVTQQQMAYFMTTTRAWELLLGGCAALLAPRLRFPHGVRALLAWLGLAAILVSAVSFTTAMPFPGLVALLPVAGTCLLLALGPENTGGQELDFRHPGGFFSLRPMTFLGDISYSLYLWHWPLITMWVSVKERAPGPLAAIGLTVTSILLAVISYYCVEQPFRRPPRPRLPRLGRHSRSFARNSRPAVGLAICLTAVSIAFGGGLWLSEGERSRSLFDTYPSADYPGATAMDGGEPATPAGSVSVAPDPAVAARDLPLVNRRGCALWEPGKTDIAKCEYGDLGAEKRVVLLGDSHAGQYSDPLDILGRQRHFRLTALTRNGCPFSAAPASSATEVFTNCSDQNRKTARIVRDLRPQLVVISGMVPAGYAKDLKWTWRSDRELGDGYGELIRTFANAGIAVRVIRDNPLPSRRIPDCVASRGSDRECSFPRENAADPMVEISRRFPSVQLVDLDRYFCVKGTCPAVVGNVLVYRDNHMTATYAKTLSRALGKELGL
ncbi:acyltransferase family protein [Arthrobacter sp. RAF14]|uniref:acyltransferase family protein n=1 Tax=Arthrobacter sp. RAF14 TaxID=3233051 RepID=UPI003F9364BA